MWCRRFDHWNVRKCITYCGKILRDGAVWSARRAHNPEVVGSNPTPAPKLNKMSVELEALIVLLIFAIFCIGIIIIFEDGLK